MVWLKIWLNLLAYDLIIQIVHEFKFASCICESLPFYFGLYMKKNKNKNNLIHNNCPNFLIFYYFEDSNYATR